MRLFRHQDPQITFTKDWREMEYGSLRPGSKLHIWYDADRLPHERSAGWTISAFAKFGDDPEVHMFNLHSQTGKVRTRKRSIDLGEGTMMSGSIHIPEGADAVELWFRNTGSSGATYWDSNFEANYVFRFAALDIEDLKATVTKSKFKVTLRTSPEVAGVSIPYRVVNVRPEVSGTLVLDREESPDDRGRIRWRGSVSVEENAVVAFEIHYVVEGRLHEDENSEQFYLAPEPGSPEAAAQAKAAALARKME